MAGSIAGLFADRTSAEAAIHDLTAAGFDPARMGVIVKDTHDGHGATGEPGTRSTGGAVAGGLIGGSAGALLAAGGALVIPGIGPFLAGGILAGSLVGGTAGWLVGGLTRLGIPEDEAGYFEREVQKGRALVTVDAEGRPTEARSIMLRNGARDLRDGGSGATTT